MGNYAGNSPSTRPGTRRRESSDMIQSNLLTSPTGSTRFSKDETNVSTPPPSLLRRRTDFKDGTSGSGLDDKDEENSKSGQVADAALPFAQLKRTLTVPAGTGVNGPSSPWSATPQSAGFSPMGAFGNFSLGGPSGPAYSPIDKKTAFGSFRGESRFKGLMNTENSEESTPTVKEKASRSSLEKLTEATNEQTFADWPTGNARHTRNDEKYGTGSAALGGDDASPPVRHSSRAKNTESQVPYDDIGFSSLGLSSDMATLREVMQRRDYSQNTMPSQNQNYLQSNEPMSPTSTNPFQSPEGEKAIHEDFEMDESELPSSHFVNNRPFGHHARGFPTQHEGTASDRSQTSSVGAPRAYPNLGALGPLSGMTGGGPWSAVPGAIGTPTRTLPGHPGGFVDSVFTPLGDFTSAAHNANVLSQVASSGLPPTPLGTAGPIGRGSKMGSLFPSAMQDQMRGESSRQESGFGESSELYQRNPSNINAPGFAVGLRDTDSPIRSGRGTLDDLFGNLDIRNRHVQATSSTFSGVDNIQASSTQIPTSILSQQPFPTSSSFIGSPSMTVPSGGSYFSRAQDQDTTAALSSQMPASQQRKMVMPDRMRWIYRDPQGNTQGPWSGLEMHDWYKAGFFSPELQVKKLEDADYEPLAQLIRRIGNSREPFLVPQIGIPHGSVAVASGTNASASGSVSATTPSAIQTSGAQPPFPSSFPSFGTTLTAEQQNALERRKQEEQYLMARQKEHLAQQQVMIKQMQHMQGGSHGLHSQQLHHHSSAHSLQSQPSYGSITSPTGYQPPPTQGPIQVPPAVPGFFDSRNMASNLGPLGGAEILGPVRSDEVTGLLDRLNTGRGGQVPFAGPVYHPGQPEVLGHSQQVAAMLQERARLQHEQEQYDMLQRNNDDHRGTSERLDQFHLLRTQMDEQQQLSQSSFLGAHAGRPAPDADNSAQSHRQDTALEAREQVQSLPPPKAAEPPSLSEQVQKAAALAKQSPNIPPQSPWAKVDPSLPQPFPPPQSSSPLPAPAAQRSRQNVAETLSAESRSRSQTPSAETPSTTIAPWAKDVTDPSKGPSLKEIQAIEARNAAQQEEIAAASRRAAAEQERQNQIQPSAPTPGLPSSANWASGVSPAVPMTAGASVWTKPVAGKAPAVPATTSTKKTLAQIQKEEEARKSRAAAAAASAAAAANAAASSSNLLAIAGGKRYADLASKSNTFTSSNSAWTTVGAGGKVKAPTGPAPNLTSRSTGTTTQPAAPPAKPKVTVSTRSGLGGSISNQQAANEEFQKWTKNALGKGLNAGIPGKSPTPFIA